MSYLGLIWVWGVGFVGKRIMYGGLVIIRFEVIYFLGLGVVDEILFFRLEELGG